jgi:hypothetical protein
MENQDSAEHKAKFEDGRLAKTQIHKILIKQEDGEVVATILVDATGNCRVTGKTPAIEGELREKIKEVTARPLTFTTGYTEKYGEPMPYEGVIREFKKDDPVYALVLVNVLNEHLWERAARLTGQQRWAVLVS